MVRPAIRRAHAGSVRGRGQRRLRTRAAPLPHPTSCISSSVLLLAALSHAPLGDTRSFTAALWGLVGLGGVVYTIIIARRMTQQSVYKPQFEDWLFTPR